MFRWATLISFILTVGCQSIEDSTEDQTRANATATTAIEYSLADTLHHRIINLDSHAGFSSVPLQSCSESDRQVDFPKMRQGGVDAVFFTVFVAQRERTESGYAQARASALALFQKIHNLVELCSDEVALARTPEDVIRHVKNDKLAVAIGIENGFAFGRDLALLQQFAELGGAYVGLTHYGHNDLADSANPLDALGDPASEHGGVSDFGGRVIAELNRLGLMIDLSHLSRAASLDAIRISEAPVIASHSSIYGIVPHPRNMDDETLLALAAKGGVIQITPVHEFIKVDPPGSMEAFYALLEKFDIESESESRTLAPDLRKDFDVRLAELEKRWALATVIHFVDHIDYAVAMVGVDHVGIGSDFDDGGITGWMHAGEATNVTAELLNRGYSEEDIERIWGGNLLRVWTEVRQFAADQHER